MRDAAGTRNRLIAAKVVPVLRFDHAAQARFALDSLLDAGFATVEITLTTPDAVTLISDLRSRVPASFIIGAGTVLDTRQAEACIAAGADYLVSPCVANGVTKLAHDAGCAALLGAFTPSEVLAALEQGSDIVKLFPAATGGPSHLAALHAVFPDTTFCPTGGVNAENMLAYFEAGAKLVGVGNSIIDRQAMKDGDQARATILARRYLEKAGVAK